MYSGLPKIINQDKAILFKQELKKLGFDIEQIDYAFDKVEYCFIRDIINEPLLTIEIMVEVSIAIISKKINEKSNWKDETNAKN